MPHVDEVTEGRPEPAGAADDAVAPGQLAPTSWREILRRAARHLFADRLLLLSAGIAFFAVLSIAPVLLTALSVYGAINTPAQALDQLSRFTEMLPPELQPLVADQLTGITAASTKVLTTRGVTGLVLALWTATTAMASLMDALTLAYHEEETRSFLRRTALAFGFVLSGALFLGALITVARLVSRVLSEAPEWVRTTAPAIVWLALGALMSGAIAVLYRFAPDRKQAQWRWISWGAMGATVVWVATSLALFLYVQHLGTYESTYGSLAGVAISMFWLWITVLLVVAGAAVNGESEHQTTSDSTVGEERPLGQRGAVVADSVPGRHDET